MPRGRGRRQFQNRFAPDLTMILRKGDRADRRALAGCPPAKSFHPFTDPSGHGFRRTRRQLQDGNTDLPSGMVRTDLGRHTESLTREKLPEGRCPLSRVQLKPGRRPMAGAPLAAEERDILVRPDHRNHHDLDSVVTSVGEHQLSEHLPTAGQWRVSNPAEGNISFVCPGHHHHPRDHDHHRHQGQDDHPTATENHLPSLGGWERRFRRTTGIHVGRPKYVHRGKPILGPGGIIAVGIALPDQSSFRTQMLR